MHFFLYVGGFVVVALMEVVGEVDDRAFATNNP
jgi:hypothetical protein